MLSRRVLFPALTASVLAVCVPELAPAATGVPHLYMARSVASTLRHPFGPIEVETWLHSGDPEFKMVGVFLQDTDYNERRAVVTQNYKEWKDGR